jgi:hypothetical protein
MYSGFPIPLRLLLPQSIRDLVVHLGATPRPLPIGSNPCDREDSGNHENVGRQDEADENENTLVTR